MRTASIVTAAFVLGSASVAFLPVAHAETSTQVLVPRAEAWFQPNPSCESPAGCASTGALPAQPPAAPPTNPYPARSLHVAVDAGQETARSYLSYSVPLTTDTLVGAVLDVPLDVAPQSGSMRPETAKLVACSFTGSIKPASGSIDPPPAADCSNSAAVTYVATPAPHLHADLGTLLARLSSGAGLVLLPDATKVAPTDAWRIVFSAHDREDAAKTAPAALTLTFEKAEVPAAPPEPEAPMPSDPGLAVAPPSYGGLTPETDPVVPPPTVQTPVTPPIQPLPQARTVTVGYAYPTIWLLPLAFLVAIPVIARSLTRDLTPVPLEAPPTP